MSYVKTMKNLDQNEFDNLLENIQCDLEGKTNFTEPLEIAYTGGINVMWCYEENGDNKIPILYSVKYENNKKLYDIYINKF